MVRYPYTRSKAELYLEKLIRDDFPDILVVGDNRDLIPGYQIDITIPDLKLAVEYWGPWHFRPGISDFENTKRRDESKRRKLEQMGWTLVIIGDPQQEGKPRKDHIEERYLELVKKKICELCQVK